MQYLYLVATALLSVVVMFLITKLLGNRQMSQLSLFDYITGITLGSIGAEMATAGPEFVGPLIGAVVYGAVALCISLATLKSLQLRQLFNGRPILLYQDGRIFEKNLSIAKLDIHEFLLQCRLAGYFDLSNLQSAILESNGNISFLPATPARPVTVADMGLNPAPERPVINLIIDGKVQEENLRHAGKDLKWLGTQLHAAGVPAIADVFLATCSWDNQLTVYPKTNLDSEKRIFH